MRGRTVGSFTDNFYKWQISVHDLDNDSVHTAKYFSIKHFNDTHGTHFNSDHLQKLRKLRFKLGEYTMEDVKQARLKTPHSVLAKIGYMRFDKIREEVLYERTVIKRIVNSKCIVCNINNAEVAPSSIAKYDRKYCMNCAVEDYIKNQVNKLK